MRLGAIAFGAEIAQTDMAAAGAGIRRQGGRHGGVLGWRGDGDSPTAAFTGGGIVVLVVMVVVLVVVVVVVATCAAATGRRILAACCTATSAAAVAAAGVAGVATARIALGRLLLPDSQRWRQIQLRVRKSFGLPL